MSLDRRPSDAELVQMQEERVARRSAAVRGIAIVPQAPPPARLERRQPGPKVRAPAQTPEHDEQVALFSWAALMEARIPALRWLFAVPNWIGTRTARHGAYLKAEGRKPGVPDVWLPIPRPGYAGCVLEMKVGRNRPSDEQRRWLAHLEASGYRVHVCYSWETARDALLAYLGHAAPPPSPSRPAA